MGEVEAEARERAKAKEKKRGGFLGSLQGFGQKVQGFREKRANLREAREAKQYETDTARLEVLKQREKRARTRLEVKNTEARIQNLRAKAGFGMGGRLGSIPAGAAKVGGYFDYMAKLPNPPMTDLGIPKAAAKSHGLDLWEMDPFGNRPKHKPKKPKARHRGDTVIIIKRPKK